MCGGLTGAGCSPCATQFAAASSASSVPVTGAKGKSFMKKPIKYTDDFGEMSGRLIVVKDDFLPPPEAFAKAVRKVKITLNVSPSSVAQFKRAADRTGNKYQTLMRQVLDTYAERLEKSTR